MWTPHHEGPEWVIDGVEAKWVDSKGDAEEMGQALQKQNGVGQSEPLTTISE